jgi:hypothetical protein
MAPQSPMPPAITLRCGQQQRAQSGKAVGADLAGGDQFAQCVLQLAAQQMCGVHQFVEEQRAMLAQRVSHRLRA